MRLDHRRRGPDTALGILAAVAGSWGHVALEDLEVDRGHHRSVVDLDEGRWVGRQHLGEASLRGACAGRPYGPARMPEPGTTRV